MEAAASSVFIVHCQLKRKKQMENPRHDTDSTSDYLMLSSLTKRDKFHEQIRAENRIWFMK